MKNNIIGSIFYLLVTLITNYSTSLLMLFIKENSDRCHYYNGKWNKKTQQLEFHLLYWGLLLNIL